MAQSPVPGIACNSQTVLYFYYYIYFHCGKSCKYGGKLIKKRKRDLWKSKSIKPN